MPPHLRRTRLLASPFAFEHSRSQHYASRLLPIHCGFWTLQGPAAPFQWLVALPHRVPRSSSIGLGLATPVAHRPGCWPLVVLVEGYSSNPSHTQTHLQAVGAWGSKTRSQPCNGL